ncbi:TPA: tail fiber protein [Yersinia enterocolitica]|nr:tail fiber protein [Yersinia enterocolitica]HDL6763547.1 tail fiber protein [Yersinia enterocolitica]HDL6953937.1 tail fiber protein [Yersinia enterocolitica]HDL8406069.1 tail fiber protein [Yersinia enterocolitica]HDM0036711.1 tail fiber protein [Yersinia enterocolitica]
MKNIMPPINTPDNAFHDGNPATGEQGTIVPGLWLNNSQNATRNIQQELISVLTGAKIEIDETKNNQLLTAILSLITASIPDLPAASLTQAGIVKLISSLTSDSESLAATAKAVKLVANAIVTSMSDHIQTANPHHQYLAIANFLSEIKDAGPAAVAQTLLNLGLGDAAKRSVGTGVNQIPDMSSFISSFAQNGYFKLPGKLIIQWGEVTGSTTATVPANFPIPFPNALMSTALAIDLIGPSYATLQNQTALGISVNTWNSAGNRAALAIRYIAIGW